jgi:hypothetical protein
MYQNSYLVKTVSIYEQTLNNRVIVIGTSFPRCFIHVSTSPSPQTLEIERPNLTYRSSNWFQSGNVTPGCHSEEPCDRFRVKSTTKNPLFLQSQEVLRGVYSFDRLPATARGTGRAGSELIEGLRMTIRAFRLSRYCFYPTNRGEGGSYHFFEP